MDPVTTAILVALATSVATGVGEVGGEKVIADAYDALKATLKRKFGEKDEVVKAVESVEAKPDSAGRRATLEEEVAAAQADQDPEVLQAAVALLDLIEAQPGGERHIQTVIGSYVAQADRGGTARVNVNQPKEE